MELTTRIPKALLPCALALLAGCTVMEIKKDSEEAKELTTVSGRVILEGSVTGTPQVQAHHVTGPTTFETVRNAATDEQGVYQINIWPGEYAFSAYIDENGNGKYDSSEPGTYFGMEERQPTRIAISKDKEAPLPDLILSGPMKRPGGIEVVPALSLRVENTGKVHSLDEEMFSRESANMGLWRPMKYEKEFGGGIMFLEPYDPDRIPVLFVHGIGGTAREFSDMIDNLDTTRFQAWVYQYASGFNLSPNADFMINALAAQHSELGFEQLVLIAHSMGGLMSRGYIHKYTEHSPGYKIPLAMTINSPLMGMDSAAMGVKTSPLTVASWHDVASGSEFVRTAHATPWPEDIPYHLVFSFLEGEEGDGTVPLSSQLTRPLQREATQIHGFKAGHALVLKDEEFIAVFNEILAEVD